MSCCLFGECFFLVNLFCILCFCYYYLNLLILLETFWQTVERTLRRRTLRRENSSLREPFIGDERPPRLPRHRHIARRPGTSHADVPRCGDVPISSRRCLGEFSRDRRRKQHPKDNYYTFLFAFNPSPKVIILHTKKGALLKSIRNHENK